MPQCRTQHFHRHRLQYIAISVSHIIFHQDCAMAQAICCPSFNVKTWVSFHASPSEIHGGQRGTVIPFPLSTAVF